jgi:mono/diheme cytochrome c family protein
MKNIVMILLLVQSFAFAKAYEDGETIYNKTCVSCHGIDGNTNEEMALVVKPRKLSKTILTKEQSFLIVKEGAHHWGARADIMPSFKSVYTDEEISNVIDYITEKFHPNQELKLQKLLDESNKTTKEQELAMLQVGEKIFKKNCSMCHGVKGNGESEYVEQSKNQKNFIYPYNLTKTLLSEEQIFLYAKYGGEYWGTMKNDMPSWKRKYDDFELKSVAKYVQEEIKQTK